MFMGATVFEMEGGGSAQPPLVKGVGTKRLGKGRVNCCCESKQATARYAHRMLNFLGPKMSFIANEITL